MSATKRVKRGWMNLLVTKVVRENHDTVTLYLVNQEEGERAFDFVAGQYLTFRFDKLSDKPIVRSYTMSGSPNQKGIIAVTVKEVENGFVSHHLCRKVFEGDVLRARGAIGRFCFEPNLDKKHLFMVGAGSGVTPFISIMREYADRLGQENAPERMTLLVSFRSRKDLICWDSIEKIRDKVGVKIITTLSRDDSDEETFLSGRINEELLSKVIAGDYLNSTFMSCGPESMMALTAGHVFAHGVAKEHMKLESFS